MTHAVTDLKQQTDIVAAATVAGPQRPNLMTLVARAWKRRQEGANLGKGARADKAALEFMCGVSAMAEAIGEGGTGAALAAFMVSIRGHQYLDELAAGALERPKDATHGFVA